MQALKDASHLYEVERRERYGARPGFRIGELQISATQQVPWHYHSVVQDTFFVVEGSIRVAVKDPEETIELAQGETFTVAPGRPHQVTNMTDKSATFLVIQGFGEYDFVPLETLKADS